MAGFQVMIAAAAVLGTFVGALGGALVWRLRWNVFLGAVLAAGAFILVLVSESPSNFTWLRTKISWGLPPMLLSFLVASLSGRWLGARMHPTWTTLTAFGISLVTGFLCLLLFRISPHAPIPTALGASACAVILLWRSRKPLTR